MKSDVVVKRLTNPKVALVIIGVVTLIIYSNVYHVPFVFDGIRQIEEKSEIRHLSNYLSPETLLTPITPRPLTDFTFALNYKFGRLNVFGYHLVNVLIHIINGFLVYFLALTIFKRLLTPPAQGLGHSNSPKSKVNGKDLPGDMPPAISQSSIPEFLNSSIPLMSLFAALIFVVHPIQTQAVTYTVQRYTSMAAMFYFLSILFYIKARMIQQRAEGREEKAEDSKLKGQSLKNYPLSAFSFQPSAYFALSFVCGILAFLSKQNSASLPAAIILVEYMLIDRTWRGWKKKLVWLIPAFMLLGIFIFHVTGVFRGEVEFGRLLEDVSDILRAPGAEVTRWSYLCTQFNVIAVYIRLLFLPMGQNLDYLYPFTRSFFDGYTPLALLFLLGIVVLGIWNVKKRQVIAFGIFWFFITLSVESSIFPIKDALFEHRLYLPMFGFALIVPYLVFYLFSNKHTWAIGISALIIVSLATATYLRNRVWQNSITLWSDVVSKTPENYRAYYNLGNALSRSGQVGEAIDNYLQALSLKPEYAIAHDNLGVALARKGRLDEAIRHFTQALRIRPDFVKTHNNLGLALMRKGNIREATRHFREALRKRGSYAQAHNNLGLILARQGDLNGAIQHFSKAVSIEPKNASMHSNFGLALARKGRFKEAFEHFSEALRIKPEYAEAHSNLGLILARQGKFSGAIKHFSKALQINPNLRQARYGLEMTLRLKGKASRGERSAPVK